MKNFNALLGFIMMVLLSLPAVGQVMTPGQLSQSQMEEKSEFGITSKQFRTNSYKRVEKDPASRANTSFQIDYDSLSNNDRAFLWFVNKNMVGNGDLNYALVTFDSLADLSGTGYDYDAHTVTIDSIDLLFSHVNGSGQEDTVIVSILELDPVTNYWTSNVLWSDSLFSSTSLTNSVTSFGVLTLTPNFAMCQGRFAVRVDFHGPTTDTLAVIAGIKEDTCATTMCFGAQDFSNFWPSTYYGYRSGGNLLELPSAMGGIIYTDCSGDMSFTPGGCEVWPIQDFWIWPSVTIQDTPPTALSAGTKSQTPDNGTGNGTATVAPTGGIGEYQVTWGTLPPQTGLTATNLSAGKYPVIITYGQGCDAIIDTVEVLGNVSIDDLDAGISSLNAFPNPNNGQFSLSLEMDNADDVKVMVYDLTGKMVYSEIANNVRDLNTQINLGDVVNGIYLLRVETSLGATTRRIVKQ